MKSILCRLLYAITFVPILLLSAIVEPPLTLLALLFVWIIWGGESDVYATLEERSYSGLYLMGLWRKFLIGNDEDYL